MNVLGRIAFAAAIGTGALALASTAASARIVCNEDGDCWHVRSEYQYQPDFKLTVHPDDWQWKKQEKYRWHEPEHEGQGYWRHGVWIQF